MKKEDIKTNKFGDILSKELGDFGWRIKWSKDNHSAVCLWETKQIVIGKKATLTLFLHELAHALSPKDTKHGAVWGDLFTTLVLKYIELPAKGII